MAVIKEAYEKGFRYYLAICTANMMQCKPEYTVTKEEAKRIARERRSIGYVVNIFSISSDGNLI